MASRRAANNAVKTATNNTSFRSGASVASKAATADTSTASTAENGASGQKPIVQGNMAPGGSAGNLVSKK